MNNETKYSLRRLLIVYYSFRYSPYYPFFVPLVSFVASIFIIWFFFIPQMQSWFSLRDEVKATQNRILTIQNNIKFMRFVSEQQIDDDFSITMKAMPGEKDFSGILTVLSESASKANVAVADYSFVVDGKAVKIVASQVRTQLNTLKSVEVVFIVRGSANSVHTLLKEIETKLPLAEIKTTDYSDNEAQIALLFYAKPIPPLSIVDTEPIEGLSSQEKEVIQRLREWGG